MPFIGNKPSAVPLTSADITDNIIVNADINSAAAITYSKLSLGTSIVNGDIANSTIALAKLSATGTASASTFLRGDNSWASAGAAAGQVIQVVTATDSTERTTTSSSYVGVSQLSVSITPASASNKILILVSTPVFTYAASGGFWTVYRGATNLATGTSTNAMHYFTYNASAINNVFATSFLDSPSTTSATTYQVYMKTASNNAYVNISNTTGSITAMEIKG